MGNVDDRLELWIKLVSSHDDLVAVGKILLNFSSFIVYWVRPSAMSSVLLGHNYLLLVTLGVLVQHQDIMN